MLSTLSRSLSRYLPQDSATREWLFLLKQWVRRVPPRDRQRQARNRRFLSLSPRGPEAGRILLSFLTEPFEGPPGAAVSHDHSNAWECRCMAEAFLEMGYRVDVIRWTNRRFQPRHPYRVCIDILHNLERLAPHLPQGCLKVLHADSAHWLFHTGAQLRRLGALKERRGIALKPMKEVGPNQGIETADCATVLGNRFTLDTFRYAGKPLLRVPVSSPLTFPWPDDKDHGASRRSFLWFGSTGFVHKGLDLVLEAFAKLPELRLTVCGPLDREPDFVAAYRRELYETPNIRTLGWVDLAGPEFLEVARSCAAVVFPSCSEGGGSAVLSCMHAGLLPVVTPEASVDIGDFGIGVREPTVAGVRSAVLEAADLPPGELVQRSRAGWEHVRRHHTREEFRRRYREVAARLVEGRPVEAVASPAVPDRLSQEPPGAHPLAKMGGT